MRGTFLVLVVICWVIAYLIVEWYGFKKKERGKHMKISDYAVHVCRQEKGKKQVSIAQVLEILKIINKDMDGKLYDWIRQNDYIPRNTD